MSHPPHVSHFDLPRIWQSGLLAEIDWHEELPSTNSRALELAGREALPLPHLVLCDRQSAGRGRGANRWWSAEGALSFSVMIGRPEIAVPAGEFPTLSLAAGLGVCEALREIAPGGEFRLKWPNDVYLGGRKVCGILVELSPASGRAVIGIGINVNNSFADAPAEVRGRATSLTDADGASRDLSEVLLSVIGHVLAEVRRPAGGANGLSDRWASVCLLTGRIVQIELGAQRTVGRCSGIAADGALVLQTESGPRRFVSGTVVSFE